MTLDPSNPILLYLNEYLIWKSKIKKIHLQRKFSNFKFISKSVSCNWIFSESSNAVATRDSMQFALVCLIIAKKKIIISLIFCCTSYKILSNTFEQEVQFKFCEIKQFLNGHQYAFCSFCSDISISILKSQKVKRNSLIKWEYFGFQSNPKLKLRLLSISKLASAFEIDCAPSASMELLLQCIVRKN